MDRTNPSRFEHRSAMPALGARTFDVLLPGAGRNGREPGVDARYRRAIPADAVLRQPQDGADIWRQSQANPTLNAVDGDRGDLSQTTYDLAGQGSQGLPVFTAKYEDYSSRSGVGERHYLHTVAAWIFVSGGGHGLVQPARPQLATFEHA